MKRSLAVNSLGFLFALLLCSCCGEPKSKSLGFASASSKKQKKDCSVLRRIAVVGASVSAGFAAGTETGRFLSVAKILQEVLRERDSAVLDFSDPLFFTDPLKKGKALVEIAQNSNPSCVIALDFLFWFAYGRVKCEEERESRLEVGLSLLDRFDCLKSVGDLPDMSQSIGIMLSAESVPRKETLKRLNSLIHRWAEKSKDARVVGVAHLVDCLRKGKALQIGSSSLKWKDVFFIDKLHPTLLGTCALLALAIEKIGDFCPALKNGTTLTDPRAMKILILRRSEQKAKLKKDSF